MSVHAPLVLREPYKDPFARARSTATPRRPRVLSHVGRWGRARRWLPPGAMRVLDVGCAAGLGCAAIASRAPAGRVFVGVERDQELLARARRQLPWLTVIDGDACELPLPDGCADAVLLLEVIEHLDDPERALSEAHRVLAPGGAIILSVPHRGPTRGLDALNLYAALRRRRPSLPALEEGVVATESERHRHYSLSELERMLQPRFTVERTARTGLGLQELVLLAMLTLRAPLRAPRLAGLLAPLYFLAYILDDLMPTGRFGYHLAVRAWTNKQQDKAGSDAAAGRARARLNGASPRVSEGRPS